MKPIEKIKNTLSNLLPIIWIFLIPYVIEIMLLLCFMTIALMCCFVMWEFPTTANVNISYTEFRGLIIINFIIGLFLCKLSEED